MENQNLKNHTRLVPLWHFVVPSLTLIALIMSTINLFHSHMTASDLHWGLPSILLPIAILILWVYARSFALKAQDRAIRAEENFRHYILTGKPLDRKLRLGQIIALRFASDDEYPALAKKAAEQDLSSKDIKQSINNWKGDHHRV